MLGTVHTFARNYGVARVMLERAVAIDPNAAWALEPAGLARRLCRPARRGEGHFEKAMRLSPLDPINFNNLVGPRQRAAGGRRRRRCRNRLHSRPAGAAQRHLDPS